MGIGEIVSTMATPSRYTQTLATPGLGTQHVVSCVFVSMLVGVAAVSAVCVYGCRLCPRRWRSTSRSAASCLKVTKAKWWKEWANSVRKPWPKTKSFKDKWCVWLACGQYRWHEFIVFFTSLLIFAVNERPPPIGCVLAVSSVVCLRVGLCSAFPSASRAFTMSLCCELGCSCTSAGGVEEARSRGGCRKGCCTCGVEGAVSHCLNIRTLLSVVFGRIL